MTAPLRLIAQDEEDLSVISAALQDAVAKVGDIVFEGDRLTLAFNRIRSALQLGCVQAVKSRKLRRDAKGAVVELLALTFEPGEAPGGAVVFTFAGGGDLRAEVECIDAALADLSAPWPTPRKPGHSV